MGVSRNITVKRHRDRMLLNALALLVGLGFVVPLAWVFLASVNPSATLAARAPETPTLSNFSSLLSDAGTYRSFLNSILLAGGAVFVTTTVSGLAAYPLSRYSLRFKGTFVYTMIFSTGLPVIALMIPVYGMFVALNMIDSLFWTTMFLATISMPFGTWVMKNFMDTIPVQLEEAAWVDGASIYQALFRVVLPLAFPGAVVVALYTFIQVWGNFFIPLVLLLRSENTPVAVDVYQFFGQYGEIEYGGLAAYSVLYSLPAVILYFILTKRFGGLAVSGALKE